MKKPLITIGIIAAVMASVPLCVAMLALYDAVRAWAWLIVPSAYVVGVCVLLALAGAGAYALTAPARATIMKARIITPVMASTGHAAYPYLIQRGEIIAPFAPMPPQPGHALTSYNVRPGRQEAMPDAPPMLPILAPVPTFSMLLSSGQLGTDGLILGYDTQGRAVTGSWAKALGSVLLAGQQGYGKTTTMRFLLAQLALYGNIGLLIGDPHANAPDESLAGALAPLAPFFLDSVAVQPQEILRVTTTAHDTMRRRLEGTAPTDRLILLVLDEFPSVEDGPTRNHIIQMVASLAREGRKVNVRPIIIGQSTSARTFGDGDTRDNIGECSYSHRMTRAQAIRIPYMDKERAALVETLQEGQAFLIRRGTEPQIVTIPNTTDADIAALAERLQAQQTHAAIVGGPRLALPSAIVEEEKPVASPLQEDCSTETPSCEWHPDLLAMVYRLVTGGNETMDILRALMTAYPTDKWAVNGGNYDAAKKRLAAIKAALLGDDTIRHRAVTRLRELQGG